MCVTQRKRNFIYSYTSFSIANLPISSLITTTQTFFISFFYSLYPLNHFLTFPSLPLSSLQVFSFRFITLFTSLYYYAFFTSDHEGALVRISVTIFSLITVGQWWGALIDICYPTIVHRALMYNMKVRTYYIMLYYVANYIIRYSITLRSIPPYSVSSSNSI